MEKDSNRFYVSVYTTNDSASPRSFSWFDWKLDSTIEKAKGLLEDHSGTITIKEVSAYDIAKSLGMVIDDE